MSEIIHNEDIKDAHDALVAAYATNRHVVALPADFKLVDITQYLPAPQRQTGCFSAEQIADVFAYYKQNKSAQSRIFVDTEEVQIKCIMDFGGNDSPGHKEHFAKWVAKPSPVYKKLLSMDNNRWEQKQFTDFLEDFAVELSALGADQQKIEHSTAIQAARNITLDTARNRTQMVDSFSASNSAMEKVSAKTDHGLPHYLQLVSPAYLGDASFMAIQVLVAIGIVTGGEKLGYSTRIIGAQQIRLQTAAAMRNLAIQATSAAEVLTGTFG